MARDLDGIACMPLAAPIHVVVAEKQVKAVVAVHPDNGRATEAEHGEQRKRDHSKVKTDACTHLSLGKSDTLGARVRTNCIVLKLASM